MILLFAVIIIALFVLGAIWRVKRWRRQQQIQRQLLRSWAAQQNTLEPAFQQWMLRISETELQILLEMLTGYCTSLNWELEWLFAPQIEKAPALKAALEKSVSNYAQSILRSLQMEEDVAAYHAYLAYEKKPTARKHRRLVQQLYAKVDSQGMITPAKGFLSRFRNKKASRQQQVDAIQQAFEHDPAQTMAHLKEVLASDINIVVQQMNEEVTIPALTEPATATAG